MLLIDDVSQTAEGPFETSAQIVSCFLQPSSALLLTIFCALNTAFVCLDI